MRWSGSLPFVAAALLICGSPIWGAQAIGQAMPATVGEIDELIAQLPAAARLRTWELSLSAGRFEQVLIGAKYGYARAAIGRWDQPDRIFASVRSIGFLPTDAEQYDGKTYVLCFDLATGAALWSGQFAGPNAYVQDLATDELWVIGQTIYCFDPATGKTVVRKQGPDRPRAYRQFQIGRKFATFTPYGTQQFEIDNVADTYNVGTGASSQQVYRRDERLSPNGLRRVSKSVAQSPNDVTTTIRVTPVAAGAADWSYAIPGYCSNYPRWDGDAILMLGGTNYSRPAAICLDAVSGRPRWETVLSHHAFNIGSHGNGSLAHDWEPIGTFAGQVAAITDDGVVWFLDPQTGEVRHKVSSTPVHLAMPVERSGNLVLSGWETISAIPRQVAFQELAQDQGTLLAHKADLLLKAGNAPDALRVSQDLISKVPDRVAVWEQYARVAEASNDDVGAATARCRILQMTGQMTSDWLHDHYGLIRRIPTGPITADLVHQGLFVYAGTQDGVLLRVNANSAQVADAEQCSANISTLSMRGGVLCRYGEDRHAVEVARVAGATQDRSNSEPDPKTMPREWNTRSGYDGAAIQYQGHYYRPLHKGRIRVSDGTTVQEFDSPFAGIERWAILVTSAGPLGYGTGGVYELDGNLCPKRQLIATGKEVLNHTQIPVSFMASDGQTLALVTSGPVPPVMQIWTIDGTKKLREEDILGADERSSSRLQAIDGGYVFVGGEVAYVPTSPHKPTWRFRITEDLAGRSPGKAVARFGPPLIVGDKLFCAEANGGIFIFDLSAITSGKAHKP